VNSLPGKLRLTEADIVGTAPRAVRNGAFGDRALRWTLRRHQYVKFIYDAREYENRGRCWYGPDPIKPY